MYWKSFCARSFAKFSAFESSPFQTHKPPRLKSTPIPLPPWKSSGGGIGGSSHAVVRTQQPVCSDRMRVPHLARSHHLFELDEGHRPPHEPLLFGLELRLSLCQAGCQEDEVRLARVAVGSEKLADLLHPPGAQAGLLGQLGASDLFG